MKIAIGCDHAGFQLKELLVDYLKKDGHKIADVGCYDEKPSDYPEFAAGVAHKVASKECERGIVLCGSGVGASVAANKVKGVRAAICHDTYSAHQGVEHDDMNVLVLGARIIGSAVAKESVSAFVNATFSSEDRHMRRLSKVIALEDKFGV